MAIRLGGMALENEVLVHGPRYWACAVRLEDGGSVASAQEAAALGRRHHRLSLRGPPVARGCGLLPRHVAACPRPGSRTTARGRAPVGAPPPRGAFAPVTPQAAPAGDPGRDRLGHPATRDARPDLAAYHGAEHISIGSYEARRAPPAGARAVRIHLRADRVTIRGRTYRRATSFTCGTGSLRLGAVIGSVAAATELFAWTLRHLDNA